LRILVAMNVLLVEDDEAMQTTLARALRRRGLQVTACGDGKQALDMWRSTRPELVLLDLSLPSLDGLEVLAHARAQGLSTPVLILTARGTVGDRVVGLNAGADDYLPKPFDLDELEARLRALHRRHHGAQADATEKSRPPAVVLGPISYEKDSGAVYLHSQAMPLPPRELALMQALMARPGHAVTKEALLDRVFAGEADVAPEAIEVVAYRLRKKLQGTGVGLMTLRGLGYLIKSHVQEPP
jgi:two-component system, OmpR family, response regulator TctD